MDPCLAVKENPGGRSMTSPWSTHPWRCGGPRMKKKNQDGWQELCIQVLPPRRCCEQIFGAKCPPRRSQICSSENWYSGDQKRT